MCLCVQKKGKKNSIKNKIKIKNINKMKYSKIILSVLAIVALVTLAAWKLSANKKVMSANAAVAEQKVTVFPVTVIAPTYQTISQNFKSEGAFVPNRQLKFASEMSGRVVTLSIKKGGYVQKGQTVATLDNEQTHIDMSLAQANLDKAKMDLSKYEIMLASNAVQKQQVEDMRMQVKSAENRIEVLQRQLRKSAIIAPMSGIVNELFIEVGSFLSPATAIADIVDINNLKLQAHLLDFEVVKVKNGQSVSVTPDLYPDAKISGSVNAISAIADGSRKFEVEITIDNSRNAPLKAGMTGTALFNMGDNKNALVIPANSIIGSVQDPQVYVLIGETVQLKKIKVGTLYNDKIEVTSGLTTKDKIVASGQLNLNNGVKVKVLE
jgi:membrane fusion protein, multidrug efflux system